MSCFGSFVTLFTANVFVLSWLLLKQFSSLFLDIFSCIQTSTYIWWSAPRTLISFLIFLNFECPDTHYKVNLLMLASTFSFSRRSQHNLDVPLKFVNPEMLPNWLLKYWSIYFVESSNWCSLLNAGLLILPVGKRMCISRMDSHNVDICQRSSFRPLFAFWPLCEPAVSIFSKWLVIANFLR